MKKNIFAIITLLIVLSAFTACDEKAVVESKIQTAESSESASEEKVFEAYIYKDTAIMMNADVTAVVASLGEPKKYFEAPSCAFNGKDKIYEYAGIQIYCMPDGEKDLIYSIVLVDDTTATPEGIALGNSKDKVIEKYGSDFKDENGSIVYSQGQSNLKFIIEDNSVIAIEYFLNT